MRLLFLHQNFPAQYRALATRLAAPGSGHEVVAIGEKAQLLRVQAPLPGVRLLGYDLPAFDTGQATLDEKSLLKSIRRGVAVASIARALARSGFVPDVVLAHIGWGEGIFVKDVFPDAKLLLYCEFYTRAEGADIGFDAEFPKVSDENLWIRVINAHPLMSLDACDWGLAPTRFQRDQFPADYRKRISVIHDGVDTDVFAPRADARFQVPGTRITLSRDDEVITFAARSLVPHRGIHTFMRALPEIQKRRPKARIVIAGSDEVKYSRPLPPGESYRQRLLDELKGKLDLSRLHFVGTLGRPDYLSLLQVSSVHVYLTYPFVLSWSFTDALAAGCLIVGSRTPPVEEVIEDGKNGLLADFFSPTEVAAKVAQALRRQKEMLPLREQARRSALERYDFARVCLPQQLELLQQLASGRLPPEPGAAVSESRASVPRAARAARYSPAGGGRPGARPRRRAR